MTIQTKDATEILKNLAGNPHRDEVGDILLIITSDYIVRIH
ncbi:hypothetical protein NPX99_07245 [Bartonella sp. 220]|nr:hypothetical protein [Bartonella sp. 220B]MCZ2159050.1 hypothetical protein [Bartonella sp. 220B]